jgi:DNA-binding NarL/FixJ family response regulator
MGVVADRLSVCDNPTEQPTLLKLLRLLLDMADGLTGTNVSLRLLVADDSEPLRAGLRILCEGLRGWQICGEAVNGEEAVAKVRELAPDVILLDLDMPVMSGFEAATLIRRFAPSTRIVFFSVHNVSAAATRLGADAFVSKSSAGPELISTIERVVGSSRTHS